MTNKPSSAFEEGDVLHTFDPETGEDVTVRFVVQDLPWEEEGLKGTISGLLLGVVDATGDVLMFPPQTSEAIGEWRKARIQKHRPDLAEEQRRRDEESERLHKHVAELEESGIIGRDGVLDEVAYRKELAGPQEPSNMRGWFEELRSAAEASPTEWFRAARALRQMFELDPARVRRDYWADIARRMNLEEEDMYRQQRMAEIAAWAEKEADNEEIHHFLVALAGGAWIGVPTAGRSIHPSSWTRNGLKISFPDGLLSWTPVLQSRDLWQLESWCKDAIWAGLENYKQANGD